MVVDFADGFKIANPMTRLEAAHINCTHFFLDLHRLLDLFMKQRAHTKWGKMNNNNSNWQRKKWKHFYCMLLFCFFVVENILNAVASCQWSVIFNSGNFDFDSRHTRRQGPFTLLHVYKYMYIYNFVDVLNKTFHSDSLIKWFIIEIQC